MSDIKISQLPVANVVNDNDIVVLNQGGDTKTAAKSLIVAGLTNTAQVSSLVTQGIAGITPASIGAISTDAESGFATTSQLSGFATTDQISGFTNSAQVEALASAQIATITPASIGALSTDAASGFATTSQISGFATTNQLSGFATTTDIQGIAFTSQLSAFATTDQLSGYATTSDIQGFTNSAQVEALASAQIAAITPASIGALSTAAASGFATTSQISGLATTSQISGFATTTDIQGIAFTSQLSGFATTDQISGFTNSAQVEALASAQIAAITPASIGAFATSDVIGISNGGTGATDSTAALAALGGMPVNQTAGGDLSGTYPDPTVAKLRGWDISTSTPFGGAVLQWIGTEWTPSSIPSGSVTSVGTGAGLTGGPITSDGVIALETTGVAALTYGSSTQVAVLDVNAFGQITSAYNAAITPAGIGALDATAAAGGDLTGNYPNPTVAKLQGYDVSSSVPTSGQVLTWNGSAWVATAPATGGSGGGGVLFYLNYGTNPDAPAPSGSKELGRVAEVAQTSVQSGTLPAGVWTDIAGFVSDTLDPNLQDIPAGIFDFNVWAKSDANANAPTSMRVLINKWDGTTSTLIATSGTAIVSNNGTTVQTAISVVIPQTDVTPSDRLYIVLQAQPAASGHTVTVDFGDGTPSHVHTTIPSVGGTGVVKVINGVPQNPASLITDSDVSTAAPLALNKVQMGQVSVLTVDGLTGGGDLSTSRTLSLTTTGVSALSYGSSTQVSAFTVDAYGRLSAASNVAISASGIGAQPALTSVAPAAIFQGGTGATTAVAALSNLGGITSASLAGLASTSQLSGFATTGQLAGLQPALTTAAPLAISQGGTGATTALAALTALGNMHFDGGWSQTSVVTGTMDTSVTPNTFTVTATGALSVDSGTPAVGDIVVFASQPTATQHNGRDNGPWVVVNPGSVGVQPTLVRPAWFSGVVKTGMLVTNQYGTARTGTTYAIQGPVTTTTGDFILVGSDILSIFTVYQRVGNASTGANTFSGRLSMAANSTTVNPISFSTAAATLLSTRQLGAIEWDNTQLYITASTQFALLNRNPIATATVLINTQTGTTFAPALTDAGRLITLSNASAIAVTIAADATTDFPVGTQLLMMQLGAGQVTVSGAAGVTIVSRSGTKTAGQYALISLIKVAANQWVVGGDATT